MKPEPYLIVIRNGPVWVIDKDLGFLGEALGNVYEGEMLMWAGYPQEHRKGRMLMKAYPLEAWGRLTGPIRYMATLVWRGLRARWLEGRRLIVISYDPLRTGVVALLMSKLTGAHFICEVNGTYWDPRTFVDASPEEADAKRRKMVRVGSYVLSRSDAIKLLYPEQLVGFDVPESSPPRVAFNNPVNAGLFRPTGLPPRKRLVFAGHPYRLKGVDVLLAAFAKTRLRFPDWELVVIGFGIEEAARADEAPTEGVEFHKQRKQHELRDLMETSAALVLPSRSEGMGRVLVEAAFVGRARLASRVGGIPTVVEDGVDGLLFRPDDVDDLAATLTRFMSDPGLQARLGEAARERAVSEFTIERYLANYETLIQSLEGSSGDR